MNVIFGVYSGYNSLKTDKGGIYYFAKSLRKYNQDCKVIILCEKSKIFKELEDLCAEYNFQIHSDFVFKYELMLNRFEIYYDILSKWSAEDVDKIMFSDLDDVVFQGDPFSIEFEEQLYCAAERNILSDKNNSSSGLNRHWIEQASAAADYSIENFEDQPVVCAGTTLGKYAGIMDYLKFYADAREKKPGFRNVPDQGLYNIYIYNHTHASSKKILPYKSSQILTLDSVSFDDLNVQDNKILNDSGQLYVILHQINRCNSEFMKNLAE
jgi:hypothetical protein